MWWWLSWLSSGYYRLLACSVPLKTYVCKMDNKFNNATKQRPQGQRTLDAALVAINLGMFIKQIREEEQWKKSDRNAITVFKSLVMRMVLIALHKDAKMDKHTAKGMINIQVLEGEIEFTTADQTINLTVGQILILHEGIEHSVYARQETVFLLTLTNALPEH
jgi:quercetin dioxygenase-like cupin family protein